jgi:hypothetical protein
LGPFQQAAENPCYSNQQANFNALTQSLSSAKAYTALGQEQQCQWPPQLRHNQQQESCSLDALSQYLSAQTTNRLPALSDNLSGSQTQILVSTAGTNSEQELAYLTGHLPNRLSQSISSNQANRSQTYLQNENFQGTLSRGALGNQHSHQLLLCQQQQSHRQELLHLEQLRPHSVGAPSAQAPTTGTGTYSQPILSLLSGIQQGSNAQQSLTGFYQQGLNQL